MWLNTYLIYYLISCLIFVIYTLLYIEEKQKQAEGKGSASTVCHPYRLVLFLFLPLLQIVRARKNKRARRREGRERTRSKDAAELFARSSPLLLLRLMSTPSTPSPAAHRLTRSQHLPRVREGRPPRPLLGDVIATPRHTSSPIDHQQQGSPSTVCHPSRRVLVLFLFPSVRW